MTIIDVATGTIHLDDFALTPDTGESKLAARFRDTIRKRDAGYTLRTISLDNATIEFSFRFTDHLIHQVEIKSFPEGVPPRDDTQATYKLRKRYNDALLVGSLGAKYCSIPSK